MIRITENIWIGNSSTTWRATRDAKIGAVLNVAQDLRGMLGWPDVEYMQVGLVDGPGNSTASYCAAVLALSALVDRHKRVILCCHTCSRSIAVAMMYLSMESGQDWDELTAVLSERIDEDVPVPHGAHRTAFDNMDWRLLKSIQRL